MTIDELKRAASHHAVEYLQSGMVVGLGSGSTSRYATLRIGELVRQGVLRDIVAIPTSVDTANLAIAEGIPLTTLEEHPRIAVTIDGADEVVSNLDVIKGLGGCLLREKIVAAASDVEIIVVHDAKMSRRLGTVSPVPVEIIRFGWKNTWRTLEETGTVRTALRMAGGEPFITDEGNYIIDCTYDGIDDPAGLHARLNGIPGVVENGMFLGMTEIVVIAGASGISVLERP